MANDQEPTQPRKHLSASNMETSIEKQIREAMERGDFENLKNKGKPLNLERDPGVPADWELAFNMLRNAGYAPDWIETKKEVQTLHDKLFAPLQRFLDNPPANALARAQQREQLVNQFRTGAAELNRLIDTYNLKAPVAQVHLRRVRIEYEIEKFLRSAS